MTDVSASILVTRSLNAIRRLDIPTYISLRYLVNTAISDDNSAWLNQMIPRKFSSGKSCRYTKIKRYKKVDDRNKVIYRDFIVPSPLTSLAESFLLSCISTSPGFTKSPSVYSYVWPSKTGCNYNFEHFGVGYRKRNYDIAQKLQLNDSLLVFITDIKNFYPSISQEKARSLFVQALSETPSITSEIKSSAISMLESLLSLSPNGVGIAVGPDFSHVVGDLILKNFDYKMDKEFPGKYFRYVDDIVVLIESKDEHKIKDFIKACLLDYGLELNEEKSEVTKANVWMEKGPHNFSSIQEISFEALMFKLKTFLLIHRSSMDSVEKEFLSRGIKLPLENIAEIGSEVSFIRKLRFFCRQRWKVAWKAFFCTQKELVAFSELVQAEIIKRLEELLEQTIPVSGIVRKWHIQRVRYFMNRAAYLFPPDRLISFLPRIEGIQELADLSAFLNFLCKGDASTLMKMPGAAVNAAVNLCVNDERHIGVDLGVIENADDTIDGIRAFSIFGLLDENALPSQVIERSAEMGFNLHAEEFYRRRKFDGFSYIDEISTLQMGHTKHDNNRMLKTRFSQGERLVLDALEIGQDYSY
jgi:hypothetical protein